MWSAGEFIKIYVNGKERASNESNIVTSHSGPVDSIFIGKGWGWNEVFKGSLMEFMLFSGALADSTIKGLPYDRHQWPDFQGEEYFRSEVEIKISGNGVVNDTIQFNRNYIYNNTITRDTLTSFPHGATVYLGFEADAGGGVDSVYVNGINIGSPNTHSYFVEDNENGAIRVYFTQ